MTVRDLLRHTSGLICASQFSNTRIDRLYGKKIVFTGDMTLTDFADSLGNLPLAHQPGEVWDYSWGVDVLARVVDLRRDRHSINSCRGASSARCI